MSGPRVIFDHVGLDLGGVEILRDVSFSVEPGEVHAIVGPNGGGKTSLMRCLLGQMPHRGEIRVEGERPRPFGYAPQFLEFDRTLPLTVGDMIAVTNQRRPTFFGAAKRARAVAQVALDRIGLKGLWNRRLGSLSGGERQRVLLAQALVPIPKLLILDEATSNMDRESARRAEGIVREIAAAGTTVIWVNHDWAQVRRVATRVTGINRTVIFEGKPRDVLPDLPMEAAA